MEIIWTCWTTWHYSQAFITSWINLTFHMCLFLKMYFRVLLSACIFPFTLFLSLFFFYSCVLFMMFEVLWQNSVVSSFFFLLLYLIQTALNFSFAYKSELFSRGAECLISLKRKSFTSLNTCTFCLCLLYLSDLLAVTVCRYRLCVLIENSFGC